MAGMRGNMVELDIKIGAGDLYDYMLMHSYNSVGGIMGTGIGAVAIIVAFSTKQWIFLIAGIILLLYLPWKECRNYICFTRNALS